MDHLGRRREKRSKKAHGGEKRSTIGWSSAVLAGGGPGG